MDTMTTTQQLGQMPGRARRGASAVVACSSWRQAVAPAFAGHDTTGVADISMHAYLGNTTTPAGAENHSFIKRHARHLGRGST